MAGFSSVRLSNLFIIKSIPRHRLLELRSLKQNGKPSLLCVGVFFCSTPWAIKKVPLLFFTITLANVDRFQ